MSRSDHHACGRGCLACHYKPARNKRADTSAEADARGLESELRDTDLPDECDGRGCPYCSEDWQDEPLPEGVTVQAACTARDGGTVALYPAGILELEDPNDDLPEGVTVAIDPHTIWPGGPPQRFVDEDTLELLLDEDDGWPRSCPTCQGATQTGYICPTCKGAQVMS